MASLAFFQSANLIPSADMAPHGSQKLPDNLGRYWRLAVDRIPQVMPLEGMFQFQIIPYMETFNKKGHDYKATATLLAIKGLRPIFAFPTFRVLTRETRSFTMKNCLHLAWALLQTEWGPILSHPAHVILDKFVHIDPDAHLCTMIVFLPFVAPEIVPTQDHMQNVRSIERWALDRDMIKYNRDFETRDFALLIDFLLGIVRPWTLHELDMYAPAFFQRVLPMQISSNSARYIRYFASDYLKDEIQ